MASADVQAGDQKLGWCSKVVELTKFPGTSPGHRYREVPLPAKVTRKFWFVSELVTAA